jgi:hypothetical protein
MRGGANAPAGALSELWRVYLKPDKPTSIEQAAAH